MNFTTYLKFLCLVLLVMPFGFCLTSNADKGHGESQIARTGINLSPEENVWLKAHPVIRMASDPAWNPIEFEDEKGKRVAVVEGYAIDDHIARDYTILFRILALVLFVMGGAWIITLKKQVTRRIRAEKSLKKQQSILSAIFKASPELLVLKDKDLVYVAANPAFCKFIGKSEDDITGKNDFDLFPQPEAEMYIKDDKRVMEKNEAQVQDEAVMGKEGVKWLQIIKTPIFDKTGVSMGILCSIRDITERKMNEEALRKTNELLEKLFETTHFSIVYLDHDFNFIRVNKAYADIFDHHPDFFTDKNIFDLYPHEENEAIFRSAVETGEPFTVFAKPFEIPDNLERGVTYWDWSLLPVRGPAGNTEALIFALVDVTQTKRAELELREHRDHLEELVAERTFQLDERVKELNCLYNISRLVQNTQISKNEIFQEIVNIIPPSWKYPDLTCAKIIVDNKMYKTKNFMETSWKLKKNIIVDGMPVGKIEVYYLEQKSEVNENLFLKEEGYLINAVSEQLGRIIEYKQAEDALKKAKEVAEAANQAKTSFLANMNHELRTPLNSILGFAQMIYDDSTISAKQRKNTRIMLQSGEHLLNLIDDILNMSKIESGRITLKESFVDLANLLNTVEQMVCNRLENKNIQFIVESGPNLPDTIETDEGKLRQILINLLGNALKFTEKGNIILRIERAEKTQHVDEPEPVRLYFEIEDTGSGIPPEDLEFIFEAFNQSRDFKHKREGTGLGLTISREFVRLMGGNISVSSQVGSGTKFKFDILVKSVVKHIDPNQKKSLFILAPSQPSHRILIVEDDNFNRQMLKIMLESAGFLTYEAVNGEDALEKYKACDPDLIWMDLALPVIDGLEVTRRIREIEMHNHNNLNSHVYIHTPIIALTANSFNNTKKAALAAGCDAFLPKPFCNEDMFKLMQKYLGVRYTCEKPKQPETKRMTNMIKPEKILTEMAAIPLDLVYRIEKNVIEGNRKKILNHIKDIRPLNSALADVLCTMVQKFEYRKILSLINELKIKNQRIKK